jgi:hypothetical protein
MVELVRTGPAAATGERIVAGKLKMGVPRVRITEAGRRAGGGKDVMIETTHIQLAGHIFDHITGVCAKCGMTRTQYDDNGEPRCPGPPPEKHERLPIDED